VDNVLKSETPSRVFDAEAYLDSRPLGLGHVIIISVLALVMLVDGYDLFVAGAVLPAIADAWHVKPSAFTFVIVAQQAGLLAGVIFVGPLSDRYGRKRMLLICLACFGLCTLLAGFTRRPAELMAVRFISALFFSGALPNCVVLASELAPKRVQAGLIGVVFCGYTGGTFITAFVLAYVLEPFGWQGGFFLGGALSLLLIPLVFYLLPESIRYRVGRNGDDPRIAGDLKKVDRQIHLLGNEHFVLKSMPARRAKLPISELVSDKMRKTTLLIWLSYFLSFLMLQMMLSWQTTVFHHVAHIPYKLIALLLGVHTVAGILGTATAGFIMDRFGAFKALPAFYGATALAFALVAFVDLNSPAALALFAIMGYTGNSAIGGLNALAAMSYPSHARVTGIAWGSGVGRLGGMLGPFLGGLLLAGDFGPKQFYLVLAIPELLAGVSIWFMRWARPVPRQAIGARSPKYH
jgi:AAHS family 4-hydroxybenzoate transporter-like MFS transporter